MWVPAWLSIHQLRELPAHFLSHKTFQILLILDPHMFPVSMPLQAVYELHYLRLGAKFGLLMAVYNKSTPINHGLSLVDLAW